MSLYPDHYVRVGGAFYDPMDVPDEADCIFDADDDEGSEEEREEDA